MFVYKLSHTGRNKLLLTLYLPWVVSEIFQYHAILSYFIAWAGSFLIFYWTLLSPLRCLSTDRPLAQQVMRPIILLQLIFAGFMCCTSIFYFFNQLYNAYTANIELLAKCQRISLLAHAAVVSGILVQTKSRPHVSYQYIEPTGNLLIKLSLFCYLFAMLINIYPAVIQYKYNLLCIAGISTTYILILGLIHKKNVQILFGSAAFILNILGATLTGYKETIIVNVIIIGFIAFPYYRKIILCLSLPCIFLLVYILPTYTNIIRIQSWKRNKPTEEARAQAYETFLNGANDDEIFSNNRDFLTNRLSEMAMFIKFVQHVPEHHPFYGWEILEDSMYALIPRAFWDEKPYTEKVAMERVYDAGVANPASSVSAKSRPVTDGYLMAGIPGVFVSMLAYGLLAQSLCNTAERLFGGYELGCIVMFNGIFQQLWRGNNFEFLMNNIFYGYILMYLLFLILKTTGTLIPYNSNESHSH